MADSTNVYDWLNTPASNATADPGINWQEGQLPSTVNNAARGMMSAISRFIRDTAGSLVTSGTANAQTLTINETFSTLSTGKILTFKAGVGNTGAATLAITNASGSVLATKAMMKVTPAGMAALASSDIIQSCIYHGMYDASASAGNGAIVIFDPTGAETGIGAIVRAGSPNISQPNIIGGSMVIFGSTSGSVTVAVSNVAGTFNFNLPTAAGTSGQPLLSGGGGTAPQTYGTLAIAAGGTGATTSTAAFDALKYSATTTSTGAIELATQTEVNAGTDSVRANTPETLAGRPKFYAHKNGTAQSNISASTVTLITFGTESFDIGAFYDTSTSKWTPPAGKYLLVASLTYNGGVVDTEEFDCIIRKNGSDLLYGQYKASGTSGVQCIAAGLADANGTDYFEVYAFGAGAGNKSITGLSTITYFSGKPA